MIRLYIQQPFEFEKQLSISGDTVHFLRSVMRCEIGTNLTLFNGKDGAWEGCLIALSKKEALITLHHQIYPQEKASLAHVTLYFCPIKAHRQSFLIEKAVELGVGRLQPVLSQYTQIRRLKIEKLEKQAIEAAEQCERLDVPTFLPLEKLETALNHPNLPILWGEERREEPSLSPIEAIRKYNDTPCGLLIGPEGGWSQQEKRWLTQQKNLQPVSFGKEILRAETAALTGLSWLKLSGPAL